MNEINIFGLIFQLRSLFTPQRSACLDFTSQYCQKNIETLSIQVDSTAIVVQTLYRGNFSQ